MGRQNCHQWSFQRQVCLVRKSYLIHSSISSKDDIISRDGENVNDPETAIKVVQKWFDGHLSMKEKKIGDGVTSIAGTI